LIGHFESADAHHHDASALLKAHVLEPFAASVITLAEIYTGAARAGRSDRLQELLAQLQVELRATTKLKMPDCCVLYTAEQHGAAIATFDDTLAARARDLGLTIATT